MLKIAAVGQAAASKEPTAEESVPERAAEVVAENAPAVSSDKSPTEAASAPMGLSESETPTVSEQTFGQDTTATE